MHCLLCHEKIPRLRAWTGKSEFCCDEHAELYKKQTMDRLLVDDAAPVKNAAPALPLSEAAATAAPPSVDHILLKAQPNRAKPGKGAQETAEVDELWKLTERIAGHEEAAPTELLLPPVSTESRDVETQSADDALAALQALAAEEKYDAPAGGDLLDEFSSMESSFDELPQLESLPLELDSELEHGELDEAPELELDAFEVTEAQAPTSVGPQLVVPVAVFEEIDAPDLQLEGLAEAQQEALEPPELAAELDAEQAEQTESLEPPDVVLEELLAAPDVPAQHAPELADPPEPADFDIAASEEVEAANLVAARTPRPAPIAAPKLRPATELQEMSPSPNFPEGGYSLKPWSDALAIAGPDRSSIFDPINTLQLRKSSLNGTASGKFDPVLFRGSERAAAVAVSILEPKHATLSFAGQNDALTPRSDFAWPAPLHAILSAAEMRLVGSSRGLSVSEASFSGMQPALSAEFLSSVVLQSRILEPRRSAILSPLERDVFAPAAADEEESGGKSSAAGRSDRDETDGGERIHVADLF